MLFVISTILVLGGLIFSVAQFALAMDKTTSYREQLSAAQGTLAGRQAELLVAKKALTTLDAQVSLADKDMKAITNSMNDLAVRRMNIDNDLQTALKSMSGTIGLTNVQHGDNLILQGEADSTATVLSYVRSLEKGGYFSSIAVNVQDGNISTNMTKVNFRLVLSTGG